MDKLSRRGVPVRLNIGSNAADSAAFCCPVLNPGCLEQDTP
jgi:hypothetical protein